MYENINNIQLDLYDDTQVVWRYMDFTKFLSMLQYKALFFCSCSLMQKMDPFEGEYPKNNLKNLRDKKDFVQLSREYTQKPAAYRRKFLENVGINCWHANDTENAAMWKVYLSSKDGIAVKSTIKNLKESFNLNEEDVVYIGNIHYNNYEFNDIDMNYNEYSPINQKTKTKRLKNDGKFVNSDLNTLIDEIIISPSSDKWYVDLVKDVVKSYGLGDKRTFQSKIYEKFD